ncbi:MAG: hypothetical protein CMJ81_24335 [Planctomycetaceae bacterium]|nr:hypothetical protein [Planctomycetaceae bacterium]MBP63903.1 hypothetical protein [Planctomycetaceae bacterium]
MLHDTSVTRNLWGSRFPTVALVIWQPVLGLGKDNVSLADTDKVVCTATLPPSVIGLSILNLVVSFFMLCRAVVTALDPRHVCRNVAR